MNYIGSVQLFCYDHNAEIYIEIILTADDFVALKRHGAKLQDSREKADDWPW